MYRLLRHFEEAFNQMQEAIDDGVERLTPPSTRQTYFIGKVKDTGEKYVVSTEVPGYEREEITLSVVSEYLHLDAKNTERSVKKAYLLPSDADGSGVEAALKNGILTISIPKKTTSKRVRIEIK